MEEKMSGNGFLRRNLRIKFNSIKNAGLMIGLGKIKIWQIILKLLKILLFLLKRI
jgi:hypothetical protein